MVRTGRPAFVVGRIGTIRPQRASADARQRRKGPGPADATTSTTQNPGRKLERAKGFEPSTPTLAR